jgi:outer membrane cobalamin receptor
VFLSRPFVLGLLATSFCTPVWAQQAPSPATAPAPSAQTPEEDALADDDGNEVEELVVTGQRRRGAALGDIPPEVELNAAEIRALGAGSLSELLDVLEPQIRSGRGRGSGPPVTLLNGRRISGFSEIRGIPPEAIERIEILPEEVALKYGYRADQRVVNIVLRRRFRATTVELQAGRPPPAAAARPGPS